MSLYLWICKSLKIYDKSKETLLLILELSKILMYEFWCDYGYGYRQFHFIHKKMIFIKILQKMLELYLILQITN